MTALLLSVPVEAEEWQQKRIVVAAPPAYEALVKEVADDWSQCRVLNVRTGLNRPDIRVTVADFGYTAGWAGQCTKTIDQQTKKIVSARVTLNTYWLERNWAGREKNLLCHEIGHCLGISGHSPSIDSCMVVGAYSDVPGATGCGMLQDVYAR